MRHAIRAAYATPLRNPFTDPGPALGHEPDGLVVIADGRIEAAGPYAALAPGLPPGTPMAHYPHGLLVPGFVDTHIHFPQLQMTGAGGEDLLGWLRRHTFPAERAYADAAHARAAARVFVRELLRRGTTAAMVYCTVHPHSVDALFEAAEAAGLLAVAGKVMMDRNAPADLLDTAQTAYDDSRALIRRWHGRGRARYAVTPRFAATSTPAQLDAAGALLREHEGLFLQTHLSESPAEVAWVKELFPARANYLDVYAHAGLCGPRSVFGHAIHVEEAELCTCHAAGAALAHCPGSNLFLGSGLFRLRDAVAGRRPVRVGLGTDVGAGPSPSMLRAAGDAYNVAALLGGRLTAAEALYLMTAGGAAALHLEDRIGRIAPGLDADLCVLDGRATSLLAYRTGFCESVEELLFVLMTAGDDRAVGAVYAAGRKVEDDA